jgi:hypothetical protein
MCSTCGALGVLGEYREKQITLGTDVEYIIWESWLRREGNIKVILRKKEFGVYSRDIRWHLTFL